MEVLWTVGWVDGQMDEGHSLNPPSASCRGIKNLDPSLKME